MSTESEPLPGDQPLPVDDPAPAEADPEQNPPPEPPVGGDATSTESY